MPHKIVKPQTRYINHRDDFNEDNSVLLNHVTLRVKDYKASLDFYMKTIGMRLTKILNIGGLSYYMLVFKRYPYWSEQIGVLILCHQPGTENDPNFKVKTDDGASQGFVNLYITGDLHDTRELRSRVSPQKIKESVGIDGFMRVFTLTDPDGYRIIWKCNMDTSIHSLNGSRLSRVVFRVRNPVQCIEFYRKTLGMKLYVSHEDETARTTSYFLGFPYHDSSCSLYPLNFEGSMNILDVHFRTGIIELQHKWDNSKIREKDVNNGLFQGFSHIGFSIIDLHEFCMELEMEKRAALDWTVDTNGEGNTEIRVKTKDPEGNAIHFISRSYYADKKGEYNFDSLGEGEWYDCEETRELGNSDPRFDQYFYA